MSAAKFAVGRISCQRRCGIAVYATYLLQLILSGQQTCNITLSALILNIPPLKYIGVLDKSEYESLNIEVQT